MTTAPRDRIVDLDVVRAVALIGVVTMNYHGYLTILRYDSDDSFVHRVFDPWSGPLSTRFAATFVMVAGMGVSLLTSRSRTGDDPVAVTSDRWRLVRRGVLLLCVGYVFDWIWPGTILYFYGAYFVVASVLFTLRTRWLVLIGVGSALIAAAVQWWDFERTQDGGSLAWLLGSSPRSPRSQVFDTVLNGTHPLFPWLAFFCAGMVLGRLLPFANRLRVHLIVAGAMMVFVTYGLRDQLLGRSPLLGRLFATDPFSRSLNYVVCTMGSSFVAVAAIGWIAKRTRQARVTQWLAVAGRSTLTLYVAHALVFNTVVNVWHWIEPTGLDTALLFAGGFWLGAIAVAVVWERRLGMAPLERIYRGFGG
jgi:uncharacterized membrane protein YeiB